MQDWTKAPWVDPQYQWKPLPVPDLPPRVLMDLATKCNLRCPMCPVWGSDDNAAESVAGVMDLAASRRILDELMAAKPLIQPNMYGEPLLAENPVRRNHDRHGPIDETNCIRRHDTMLADCRPSLARVIVENACNFYALPCADFRQAPAFGPGAEYREPVGKAAPHERMAGAQRVFQGLRRVAVCHFIQPSPARRLCCAYMVHDAIVPPRSMILRVPARDNCARRKAAPNV